MKLRNSSASVAAGALLAIGALALTATPAFADPLPPSVEALFSTNLTATSAVLHTTINPQGTPTIYYFEYGTTTAYGQSSPSVEIGEGTAGVPLSVELTGLQRATYHFRVVATNAAGTTATSDQTFNFFPPSCPNATLRQQTGAEYLPDCRAYELVSPANAGSVILEAGPGAPPPSSAENNFAFLGGLGAISGTNPPDGSNSDTYVATRTDTGWETHYVGLQGDETLAVSPLHADNALDKFIDFATPDSFFGTPQPPNTLPFVWDADGASLDRWPATFAAVPNAEAVEGAFQPSPNFQHLAFSSNNIDFGKSGAEGLTTAPGSAYDYNVATQKSTLISVLPTGDNIPQESGNNDAKEFINFPGDEHARVEYKNNFSQYNRNVAEPAPIYPSVSTDGSHILMSTYAVAPPCGTGLCNFDPSMPTRLYMRVRDLVTYDVSENQLTHEPTDVTYVGMTSDGSKVFFTSREQLTSEDHDTSTDLYMWSEKGVSEGRPVTLVSIGNTGAGNSDTCHPESGWTGKCDVVAVVPGLPNVGDSALAHGSGGIYFYSPEQLDGSKGTLDKQNLYLSRDGHLQYVATFSPEINCEPIAESPTCGNGPIGRMDVSPDARHMAFVTAQQMTGYDNRDDDEMYTYDAESDKIVCVSCNPTGAPPVAGVTGAAGGLFMSNDGRTFFYTRDALVPQDTNNVEDVYEYVDGRPQLITPGTQEEAAQVAPNQTRLAGLQGVTESGTNVYFAIYATLVGQDENGQFLKFYDARTDGGFFFQPPPPPCEAADECHGAGSQPPAAPAVNSGVDLGSGGNVDSKERQRGAKRRHRRRPHKQAHKRGKRKRDTISWAGSAR